MRIQGLNWQDLYSKTRKEIRSISCDPGTDPINNLDKDSELSKNLNTALEIIKIQALDLLCFKINFVVSQCTKANSLSNRIQSLNEKQSVICTRIFDFREELINNIKSKQNKNQLDKSFICMIDELENSLRKMQGTIALPGQLVEIVDKRDTYESYQQLLRSIEFKEDEIKNTSFPTIFFMGKLIENQDKLIYENKIKNDYKRYYDLIFNSLVYFYSTFLTMSKQKVSSYAKLQLDRVERKATELQIITDILMNDDISEKQIPEIGEQLDRKRKQVLADHHFRSAIYKFYQNELAHVSIKNLLRIYFNPNLDSSIIPLISKFVDVPAVEDLLESFCKQQHNVQNNLGPAGELYHADELTNKGYKIISFGLKLKLDEDKAKAKKKDKSLEVDLIVQRIVDKKYFFVEGKHYTQNNNDTGINNFFDVLNNEVSLKKKEKYKNLIDLIKGNKTDFIKKQLSSKGLSETDIEELIQQLKINKKAPVLFSYASSDEIMIGETTALEIEERLKENSPENIIDLHYELIPYKVLNDSASSYKLRRHVVAGLGREHAQERESWMKNDDKTITERLKKDSQRIIEYHEYLLDKLFDSIPYQELTIHPTNLESSFNTIKLIENLIYHHMLMSSVFLSCLWSSEKSDTEKVLAIRERANQRALKLELPKMNDELISS